MIEKLLKLASETIEGCLEQDFIKKMFDCELTEEENGKLLIEISTDIETLETVSKKCEFDIDFFKFFSDEDKKIESMEKQFIKCVFCLCNSLQEDIYKKEGWTKIELKNERPFYIKGAVTFKDNFIVIPKDNSINQQLRYINCDFVFDVTIL